MHGTPPDSSPQPLSTPLAGALRRVLDPSFEASQTSQEEVVVVDGHGLAVGLTQSTPPPHTHPTPPHPTPPHELGQTRRGQSHPHPLAVAASSLEVAGVHRLQESRHPQQPGEGPTFAAAQGGQDLHLAINWQSGSQRNDPPDH